MKKTYKLFIFGLITFGIMSSCSDDFGDINVHPEKPTQTAPDFLFTGIVRQIGYKGGENLYLYNPQTLPITRLATILPVSNMDEFTNESGVNSSWNQYYDRLIDIKALKETIANSAADPERHKNQLAIIDICQAYFAFLTIDKFGDAPFSEAGLASEGIFRPKYDKQGAIYSSLLTMLANATAAINATGDTPAGESYLNFDASEFIFPRGDFTNWQKFGNALILKYALRMSKFDQSGAQSFITTALQGPLMTSIADGAQIIPFNLAGYTNQSRKNAWAWARYYGPTSQPAQFMASKLVTAADIANVDPNTDTVFDPRFFGIYFPNKDGEYKILPNSPDEVASEGAALNQPQVYPNGEWAQNIMSDYTDPAYEASHAVWNRMYTMSLFQAQKMLTFQEHSLILAEIYASGLASGDSTAAYEAGVRAAVEEFLNPVYTQYPDNNPSRLVSYTVADLDALIANPNVALSADSATALEQIRTQRWIDYLYQPDQAWSLIRRTNLFDLDVTVPIVNDATTVPMIWRIKYPANEGEYNTTNYLEQLGVMGGTDDVRYKSDIFK